MVIHTHSNDIHCINLHFQISQILHDIHSKLQIVFNLECSKYKIICIDHIPCKNIIIQQYNDNIIHSSALNDLRNGS